MDVSRDGGVLHFLVRGRDPAVTDIFTNVIVKEDGVLGHNTDMGTQRGLLHLHTHTHLFFYLHVT